MPEEGPPTIGERAESILCVGVFGDADDDFEVVHKFASRLPVPALGGALEFTAIKGRTKSPRLRAPIQISVLLGPCSLCWCLICWCKVGMAVRHCAIPCAASDTVLGASRLKSGDASYSRSQMTTSARKSLTASDCSTCLTSKSRPTTR